MSDPDKLYPDLVTALLITEISRNALKKRYRFIGFGSTRVKGKRKATAVYYAVPRPDEKNLLT